LGYRGTMDEAGQPQQENGTPSPPPKKEPRWHKSPVLYPRQYGWYVIASTLNIVVTVFVLVQYHAQEVNSLAQRSIELFGTWGLVGLKFLTLALVVSICEYVGRRRPRLGKTLAVIAIFASLFPVCAAAVQVLYLWATGELLYQA
jgi:hypothetical protein